jgi:hypothetical protein
MLRGGVTVPAAVVLVHPPEILVCTALGFEATLLGGLLNVGCHRLGVKK